MGKCVSFQDEWRYVAQLEAGRLNLSHGQVPVVGYPVGTAVPPPVPKSQGSGLQELDASGILFIFQLIALRIECFIT